MSSGFSKSDLDSFFDTDGVAVAALITGPEVDPPAEQFTKTINVILSLAGAEVGAYGDTTVYAIEPSFLAKSTDVADVKKGYTVTFPALEAHEDGYGKTYKVTERFEKDGPQAIRVTLKEQ